jgi:hypothetical protein
MSQVQSFKLIKGSEIRKLGSIPQNYRSLLAAVSQIFGSGSYQLTYTDQFSNIHTISTDSDLNTALALLSPKVRIEIKDSRSLFSQLSEKIECLSNDSDQDQIDFLELVSSEEESSSRLPSIPKELTTSHLEISKGDIVNISEAKYGDTLSSSISSLRQSDLSSMRSMIQEEVKRSVDSLTSCRMESVKIVHYNVRCDGCGKQPILGVRYRCSICRNFNYCQTCEEAHYHVHPFLKYKLPEDKYMLMKEDQNYDLMSKEPNLLRELLLPFETLFCSSRENLCYEPKLPKYSMLCIDGNNTTELTCYPTRSIDKQWLVKNTGRFSWMQGTSLKIIDSGKGDIKIQAIQIPMLKPSEEGYIYMEYQPGSQTVFRSFCLVSPTGIEFGNLNLNTNIRNDGLRENLKILISKGFECGKLKKCIDLYEGNVDLAVLHLLSEREFY